MSIESARAFTVKMKEDEAFRKSFMAAGSREKSMELAKARGYDFTLDEIRQVREEELVKLKEADRLSDEDLAKVAAGCGGGGIYEGGGDGGDIDFFLVGG